MIHGSSILAGQTKKPFRTPIASGAWEMIRLWKSLKLQDDKIVSDYDKSEWRIGEWRTVPILKKNNIKYILVSSSDHEFYRAMQWYSKSSVPYNESYLYELITGAALNVNSIYDRAGVKVYRV